MEEEDEGDDTLLFGLLAGHAVITFLHVTYPFLTWTVPNRDRWDVVYLLCVGFIYCHTLLFRNECIVAFWEKRLIDPSYEMGECPFVAPFRYRIEAVFGIPMGIHSSWLALLSTCLVLWRMQSPAVALRRALALTVFILYVTTSHLVRTQPSRRCVRLQRRCRCMAAAATTATTTKDDPRCR